SMKTTAEKIAVMQAYEDRRDVEFFSASLDEWILLTSGVMGPEWDWKSRDYRVKREPQEVWLLRDPDDGSLGHACYNRLDDAERSATGRSHYIEVVKFREVIE
ncbi:MAG: hypothetical protein AAF290_05605, partial [Pseudomonadota bacterium]